MEIMLQKIDKATLDKARHMYFSNCDVTEICTVLSLDVDTIRFYVFGEDEDGKNPTCWSNLRKKTNKSAMSMFLKDKVNTLDITTGVAVEILSDSLFRLRDDMKGGEKTLTIDEMSKIAKIVTDLDKIVRLERGTATELIDFVGLSRAEAKEVLANDPFANAIDVESVEILPWLKDEVEDEKKEEQ